MKKKINWKKILKQIPLIFLLGWFVGTFTIIVLDMLGLTFMKIKSGSMLPELKIGCLVLMKKIENATEELNVGDIAVYLQINEDGKIIGINHRINKSCEGGWVTKGDANDKMDGCIPYKRFTYKMIWRGC